jgi:hypothetical protein
VIRFRPSDPQSPFEPLKEAFMQVSGVRRAHMIGVPIA